MNTRIYRYQLTVEDLPTILMPAGARVLSVAPSRTEGEPLIDLWALVDPEAPTEPRTFRVGGTGNPIDGELGKFVGTVPLLGGSFIGHVFEAGNQR